jgi:hypothetical protein
MKLRELWYSWRYRQSPQYPLRKYSILYKCSEPKCRTNIHGRLQSHCEHHSRLYSTFFHFISGPAEAYSISNLKQWISLFESGPLIRPLIYLNVLLPCLLPLSFWRAPFSPILVLPFIPHPYLKFFNIKYYFYKIIK